MPVTNYKNTKFEVITTHRTIPANSTKTGTIQTVGKDVIGTGTLFTTEVKKGDWVCDIANDEIRKVIGIGSNTSMQIDNAFTTPIAALSAFVLTPLSDLVEIAVVIPVGSPNGTLDGTVLPNGIGFGFGKSSRDDSSTPRDFVDPIIVNGTGTTIYVETLK